MHQGRQGFSRVDRVRQQIQRELSLLLQECDIEQLRWVTLQYVRLARDYSRALVHFTVLDDTTLEQVQSTLDGMSGLLRKELGQRIRLYRTPELCFVHDDALRRGERVRRLLDDLKIDDPDPLPSS